MKKNGILTCSELPAIVETGAYVEAVETCRQSLLGEALSEDCDVKKTGEYVEAFERFR